MKKRNCNPQKSYSCGRALIGKLASQVPDGVKMATSGVYSPFGRSVLRSMKRSGLAYEEDGVDYIDVSRAKKEFNEEEKEL